MAKPKLTTTTNDKVKSGNGTVAIPSGVPPSKPRIVEAHEPLSTGEPWAAPLNLTQLGLQAAVRQAQPVQLPAFPLIQAEQIVNMPPMQTPAPGPIPVAEPLPLKVALVGTAPSSRMLAPYQDPSWKIWVCSPGNMNIIPRIDAWFEIHNNLMWEEYKHYGIPYLKWLSEQTFPLYMQDKNFVQRAEIFPKDELVKMFGRDFFTSSFTWMMGFALLKGAKEIALYGIDMASRDEYILQRPGFFFFKYMAEIRGVKVSAPYESDIMQSPGLYAYSDSTPFGRKIHSRELELKQRIGQAEQAIHQQQQTLMYLKGALEDIDYFKSIWIGVDDRT